MKLKNMPWGVRARVYTESENLNFRLNIRVEKFSRLLLLLWAFIHGYFKIKIRFI